MSEHRDEAVIRKMLAETRRTAGTASEAPQRSRRPGGYRLKLGANVSPMFQPNAWALQGGAFCASQVWVTAYEPSELWAAGAYPYQSPGGTGLPAYAQANRALEATDVVV